MRIVPMFILNWYVTKNFLATFAMSIVVLTFAMTGAKSSPTHSALGSLLRSPGHLLHPLEPTPSSRAPLYPPGCPLPSSFQLPLGPLFPGAPILFLGTPIWPLDWASFSSALQGPLLPLRPSSFLQADPSAIQEFPSILQGHPLFSVSLLPPGSLSSVDPFTPANSTAGNLRPNN